MFGRETGRSPVGSDEHECEVICPKLRNTIALTLSFCWQLAFYSAIHFVEDKILPKKIGNIHCKNINDVKQAYQMSGRHQARERLVSENLSLPVAVKYKWLDDMSRNSRYVTYKVPPVHAEKALQYLGEIYNECYQ